MNNGLRTSLAIVLVFLLPATAIPNGLPDQVFESNLTDADRASLAEAETGVRKSIFFVGHPSGSSGTAFLVSRERRLLATAAHVADIFAKSGSLIAIPYGEKTSYRVQRVYYHPDVLRVLDRGLHVRSDKLDDGDISTRGPDIALLELAPGGPELPEACVLANDDEIRTLGDSPIVGLGHPDSHMSAWPAGARPFAAKSATGRILGMTAFPPREEADVPIAKSRRVLYTGGAGAHGFSGGPICLPNGHVIAIVSHGIAQRGESMTQVSMRIDGVRDMLAQPSLAEAPGDPRLPQLRQAIKQLKQCRDLVDHGQYQEAVRLTNGMILQNPSYAYAYVVRGYSYLLYAYYLNSDLDLRRRMLKWAGADFLRAAELDPDFASIKSQHYACRLQITYNQPDQSEVATLLQQLDDEIARSTKSSWARAEFLNVRALCRAIQRDLPGARADIDEAIRLASNQASHWETLGYILDLMHKPQLASDARQMSKELKAMKSKEEASP